MLSSINEGEISGKVYRVENGKIYLSGGGPWEFKFHRDNYPEVGKWVTVRYENGNEIVWWRYYQPKGISYLFTPIVILAILTTVLFLIGYRKGWLKEVG
jgi:hypothetical protein